MTSVWHRPGIWIVLLLLVAFWGSLWFQLDSSVLTRVPILDEAFYLRAGAQIARGQPLPDGPFIMSPLYPYLVALTGSGRNIGEDGLRPGPPPWGIRLLQALAWCGIALLLWRAARRLLGTRLAVVPPLLFVLYAPAAIFATTTLLEIPLTFVVTLFLYLLVFGNREATAGEEGGSGTGGRRLLGIPLMAIWAGALVAAATLLRGHALLLLPLCWLAWRRMTDGKQRVLVAVITTGLLLAPAVLHNSLVSNRPVGTSCNGGLNLYIGNGPEADGFYISFAGFDFESDPAGVSFLSEQLQRPVAGVAEADRIWFGAAWQAIREDPSRFFILWGKKVWLHLVGWEISQVTPLPVWARDGPSLRLLVMPYGLLVAAGLCGLVLVGWRRGPLRIWFWAFVVLVAGQSLFFVVARYRLVLVPILCLFAGAAVHWVGCRWRRRLLPGFALAVGAVLVTIPWGLGPVRNHWQAIGLCNEAVRWEWLGEESSLVRAAELYEAARDLDPEQMISYRNLARIRVQQARPDEAERILARAVLVVPRPAHVEQDLIHLLLEQGRVDAALPRLAAYLRDHPPSADILHNYTIALARTGRIESALTTARQLVELAPDDSRGYIDLGVLLARGGRRDEARDVFTAGLERLPGQEDLLHNLESLDN
ncbi:MAG: tetratricopeptide repeat protein [bacterium]